jgi:sugar lactone lactonase YvrE
MRLTGAVWVPASLLDEAGGSIISNNAGGLVGNGGSLSSKNTAYRLQQLAERTLEGATVVLADAQGVPYAGIPAVSSNAQGQFVFPAVPKGLTYQVVASVPTVKGKVRLSALSLPDAEIRASVASTVVAQTVLKETTGALAALPSSAKVTTLTEAVTRKLTPESGKLVFASGQQALVAMVFSQVVSKEPELQTLVTELQKGLKQITPVQAELAKALKTPERTVPSPSASVSSAGLSPGPALSPTAPASDVSATPSATPTPMPSITVSRTPSGPGPSPSASVSLGLLGVVSTLAGLTQGYGDGTGATARFSEPSGVAVDTSGNVYVADWSNHRIRKVTPTGVVTTLAGSTQGDVDGIGVAAQFANPYGVAVDTSGNVYVADTNNYRIRKVTPTGVVTTLAGSMPGDVDGTTATAQFSFPFGIAVDASGNVYVADRSNHRIRKVTPTGVVTTLAGSTRGYGDGTGATARFSEPSDVAVDGSGNVYVADQSNHRIRKVTPTGVVTTLAGSTQGYADDTGAAAQFSEPSGIAVDGSGNVYVADQSNHRIRKVTPTGVVTTLAGSTQGYADDTGAAAQFSYPFDVAIDASGRVYVADWSNHRIRKIQ